jgi:predicted DNA-binding transcriptional regulator AlpA
MPNADTKVAAGRTALTIPEFCAKKQFSEPFYYKLKAQGLGPREMRLGPLVRISPEAEDEWDHARSNPVGEEAEEIARTAKAMQERGRSAAKKAIASPRHVSRNPTRRGCRAGAKA